MAEHYCPFFLPQILRTSDADDHQTQLKRVEKRANLFAPQSIWHETLWIRPRPIQILIDHWAQNQQENNRLKAMQRREVQPTVQPKYQEMNYVRKHFLKVGRRKLNHIQTRLFVLQKHRGHFVPTPTPLTKTLLPFSESIQVTFFWMLVQRRVSWIHFGFHGNHLRVLRLFIAFPFLTGNPFSKIKSLFPLLKKMKLNDIILVANLRSWSMEKSVKKNCHKNAFKRNIRPKFPQQSTFRSLFMEKAKKTSSFGELFMKTAEMCFSKTCVNFARCYVNQGWAEGLKNIFVLKIKSFIFSESFKSPAQGVLEIFEEVYLGAHCAPPPTLVGIGLNFPPRSNLHKTSHWQQVKVSCICALNITENTKLPNPCALFSNNRCSPAESDNERRHCRGNSQSTKPRW